MARWGFSVGLGDRLLSFFTNAYVVWGMLGAGSGSVTAWAAYATQIFDQYAPFSWVLAGFIGPLIVFVIYALFSYAKVRMQLVRIRSMISESDFINPLDKTFESRRIHIVVMAPPIAGPIKDKIFVDCDIVGPANAFFFNCTFHNNSGEALDAVIVKDQKIPKNVFAFLNCSFANCRFYAVTFMVPEKFYNDFQRHGWINLNWITDIPEVQLNLGLIPQSQPDDNRSLEGTGSETRP